MNKAKEISFKKLNNIKKALKLLDNDKEKLGMALLDEVFFCGRTLADLKEQIDSEGTTTIMDQGKYTITRANPNLESYNKMIKNYQSLLKQISELLGQTDSSKSDELKDFLK